MSFPADQTPLLDLITWQWPTPLMLLAVMTVVVAWRIGRATARALAAAIVALVLLHALAWLGYGSGDILHLACSAVGLALIVPIALRARGRYPLVVAAAMLVAFLALLCATIADPSAARAARLIAGLANVLMLGALWCGMLMSRRHGAIRAASSRSH